MEINKIYKAINSEFGYRLDVIAYFKVLEVRKNKYVDDLVRYLVDYDGENIY